MTSIGVIGAGAWGTNWIRTLAAMPEVQLRWVCDLSEATLARVQRQFPQVRTTGNVDDLFHDAALDGIVLATIAPTHFELAAHALRAGKHIMVEKPMTLNVRDGVELVRLAERVGKVLMVGHLLEYHPAILYIKDLIRRGELGEVYYIYSQRLNHGTVRRDENAWWSLAPHDISVANRLLGEWPVSVQCRGQSVVQKGIPDVVLATLEYPGGRLAHMHVSWLDPHKTRKLTVVGSRKMVTFDDTLPAYKVTIYDKCFKLKDNVASYAEWISLHSGDIITPKLDNAEPLLKEARHFVQCISTGETPVSDGRSGVAVVAVLESGQCSMDSGKIVSIPPPEFSGAGLRQAG